LEKESLGSPPPKKSTFTPPHTLLSEADGLNNFDPKNAPAAKTAAAAITTAAQYFLFGELFALAIELSIIFIKVF
jgi:hypothetical protein